VVFEISRATWRQATLSGSRALEDHMRWRIGIVVGIGVVIALASVVIVSSGPGRSATPIDASPHGMPVFRSRATVDPRMPILDSMLPLSHGSARTRRGPPLRGWQR
jgi:hypothetical protein